MFHYLLQKYSGVCICMVYLNQVTIISGLLCCAMFVAGHELLHSQSLPSIPKEYQMSALPRGLLCFFLHIRKQ